MHMRHEIAEEDLRINELTMVKLQVSFGTTYTS